MSCRTTRRMVALISVRTNGIFSSHGLDRFAQNHEDEAQRDKNLTGLIPAGT